MHSALYRGWVSHRRVAPTRNAFRYRLYMAWLDLAELPGLFDPYWGWSARRPAIGWFRRRDYLAPHEVPLDTAVRDLVASRIGRRPIGPIRLLTHVRTFGYCFNPVSFYYCYDPDERLDVVVAEITNTPWGERHQYVLEVAGAEPAAGRAARVWRFPKAFHVSPFLPMDLDYEWRFDEPAARLHVHMRNSRLGAHLFDATLSLARVPLNATNLARVLVDYPLMTVKVVAMIHWQALKLLLKRTPFYPHPAL